MGGPRVHSVAAVEPHPAEVVPVQNLEAEPESLLHLGPPLLEDRSGSGDHDRLDFLPQQELACDQAGLDRLAEAGVVGDEQADAGHPERHPQRLHLVGVQLDTGAERRQQESGIGRADRVPAERVHIGREPARRVEPAGAKRRPRLRRDDSPIGLAVPEDFEFFALGVVVGAGERHARGMVGLRGRDDPLHEPGPLPNLDELADLRRIQRQADVDIGYGHGKACGS